MTKIIPITLMLLLPSLALAHPGHTETHFFDLMSAESIEFMMASFVLVLVLTLPGVSPFQRVIAAVKNRLDKRK